MENAVQATASVVAIEHHTSQSRGIAAPAVKPVWNELDVIGSERRMMKGGVGGDGCTGDATCSLRLTYSKRDYDVVLTEG
jgi:hypothetical protein